ncbi:hypothetical protein II810_05080 [bacterium]|jgi:hypothetical protein|nr:hypothetical protein [bacterium]
MAESPKIEATAKTPLRYGYFNQIGADKAYGDTAQRVSRNQDPEAVHVLPYVKPFGVAIGEGYGYGEGNHTFGANNVTWQVDKGGYSVPIQHSFRMTC